eukprot:116460-Pelagomonas_calceolata.AAC.3
MQLGAEQLPCSIEHPFSMQMPGGWLFDCMQASASPRPWGACKSSKLEHTACAAIPGVWSLSYGELRPTPPACLTDTDTQVALLRSAVKLEQEQQFLIAKKLQELSGSKNIKLKPTIDASVIAGFIVEYGSQQIDMSVRGQVDNVTETCSQTPALAPALMYYCAGTCLS